MAATSSPLATTSLILGTVTFGGGAIGFAKTGSVPSIAAGSLVGILYGLGGYRIATGATYGVGLSLLASAVLGASSIPRAIRGRKPVPIVLSLISAFGLFTFGTALREV
ncbi:hypothetical protein ACHAQJ_007910 [Trichoderma viride]